MVRSEGDNDRYAAQKECWDEELGTDELTPAEIEDADQTTRRKRFFGTLKQPRRRE